MLSPRFAQKNRKYKNKKKTAEKEPWAEEAPYPWGKYRFRGLHGAASL
jgi:hypothetical protein